jgi:FkbM family methyltransferase
VKEIGGVWLPDSEQHLVDLMPKVNVKIDGKLTYQYKKLKHALQHVKQWRTAIDIGAHVGLWSMHLVKNFDKVIAFEPSPEHGECFHKNVHINGDVEFFRIALGESAGWGTLAYEKGSSGGTHIIRDDKDGNVLIRQLDDFNFKDIDFIKIDVEGFELYVVQGGELLIRQYQPVIIIEQKPKGLAERYGVERMAAVKLLQSWGAKVVDEISGDFILKW